MKLRWMSLLLALVLFLTGCGRYDTGYAEGYAAALEQREQWYDQGYADGVADWPEPTETAPPPTTEPTVPTEPKSEAELAGFVHLGEEVPEILLEIRYYTSFNFVGERIDGYEAPEALVTARTAEALKVVCADLEAQGYRLKVYDAYRPQQAVAHFQRWAEDLEDTRMKAYFYPEIDKSTLFDRGFISARSGHSRGSTVDVSLVDMATGKDVDMGTPFDFFGSESHADYTETLTDRQIANRQILRDAMVSAGFQGIRSEWWHFRLAEEPYPDTYFDFPVE